MSKAFTSEENEDEDFFETPALSPGVKNYITAAGAQRLRQEIAGLLEERTRSAGAAVAKETALKKIDRRLRFLASRLEAVVIVDPAQQPKDQVAFGATVTVVDAQGEKQSWRIVGLDETDLDRGWISWMSPLANALLEKRVGDPVSFNQQRLAIQKIRYEA